MHPLPPKDPLPPMRPVALDSALRVSQALATTPNGYGMMPVIQRTKKGS